jgi:predicted nucleic acid-binding protein
MSDKVFLDSNILLYAFFFFVAEKKKASMDIINSGECYTCLQALNEFCNVCLKKWKFDRGTIELAISRIFQGCMVLSITAGTLLEALMLHERYGYSYYDCVMLACALENGCTKIYTEDMSSGQIIEDRLLILNPYEG